VKAKRFVLLDRDGTVNIDRGYINDPDELELIRGAGQALAQLREQGLGLVIVSNQSGIGRGFLDEADLERIHARLTELLSKDGTALDGIYCCPHLPTDRCVCRKPETALVARAAAEHGFDPAESFVVGDKACDIELGQRVGATTILVRTGYGDEAAADSSVDADHIVADLPEAADLIVQLVASRLASAPASRGEPCSAPTRKRDGGWSATCTTAPRSRRECPPRVPRRS
jgi:D-glycero-D-manno-heptose 1,7-bisphosphate phosphatase